MMGSPWPYDTHIRGFLRFQIIKVGKLCAASIKRPKLQKHCFSSMAPWPGALDGSPLGEPPLWAVAPLPNPKHATAWASQILHQHDALMFARWVYGHS